jgi:hypothetical protein
MSSSQDANKILTKSHVGRQGAPPFAQLLVNSSLNLLFEIILVFVALVKESLSTESTEKW